MNNSIYVSVPSVEDQEIFNVAEKAFDEADNPDLIYMGICHSIPFKNKSKINKINNKISGNNISQKFINAYRNMGVGYGRKGAMSMYSKQDYVLQIDGHTNFSKSWDSILIDLYNSTPKEMAGDKHMLTAYLPSYQLLENNVRYSPDFNIPRYPCYPSLNNKGRGQGLDIDDLKIRDPGYPSIPWWVTIKSTPGSFDPLSNKLPKLFPLNIAEDFLPEGYVYSRKINANFIFCDSRIIDDYDAIYKWDYLFFEEEFIGSIEALAADYNMIFPNFELPLTHLYMDWFNEFYNEKSRITLKPNEERLKLSQDLTFKYLSNKDNEEKIKKYCEYAGLTYPEFQSIDTFYTPGENYGN